MNTRAIVGLAVSSLVIGLLGGLAIGADGGGTKTEKVTHLGPTKTAFGMPVGYSHSALGAVAAAAAYSRALNELALLGQADRDRALAFLSTSEGRNEVQAKAREAFEVIDKGLGLPAAKDSIVIRSAALGHKVLSFTPDAATIDVWNVDVIGKDNDIAPRAGWGISTFVLKWEMDDWKLATFPQQVTGPTPTVEGSGTAEDLPRIRTLKVIPDGSTE